MDFSIEDLLSFATNFLLVIIVCFLGSLSREAYVAANTRTKMSLIQICVESISAAFISIAANEFLKWKEITITFEVYMVGAFLIGFFTNIVLELVTDRKIINGFFGNIIAKFGVAGKAFVDAWKDADDEKAKRKEAKSNKNAAQSQSSGITININANGVETSQEVSDEEGEEKHKQLPRD